MSKFNFNQFCERCGEGSPALKMSFFNKDMCCMTCLSVEQQHPKYEEARKKEHQECLNGNYNYDGIGLPEDYSSWQKNIKKN